MGKRSDFERKPYDFYPTPAKAVQPLIPYLRAAGIRTFAEPCCGSGDLVRHLKGHGLTCAYRGDIATGQDTFANDDCGDIDVVITNPPHIREVMHPMIAHFQRTAPMVWLLIDLDWVHDLAGGTVSAALFRRRNHRSRQMVPGLRTRQQGAWFRFAADYRGVTAIAPPPRPAQRDGPVKS